MKFKSMGTAEDVKWHKISSRKMLPTLTKDAKRVLRCLQKIIASACAWQLHRTSLFLYLYNKNHNTLCSCWRIFPNHRHLETNWKGIEQGEDGMQNSRQTEDNSLLRKRKYEFFSRKPQRVERKIPLEQTHIPSESVLSSECWKAL